MSISISLEQRAAAAATVAADASVGSILFYNIVNMTFRR